jgi:hypothetical protein
MYTLVQDQFYTWWIVDPDGVAIAPVRDEEDGLILCSHLNKG